MSVGVLPKCCTDAVQHHLVKFLFLLVLRFTAFCWIIEIPDVLFSISARLRIKFPWPAFNGSLMASGRPELDAAPVASLRPELHGAPVAVMVNLGDLDDTVLLAWSRLQLCILVGVLRDSLWRHSWRWCSSQSVLSNELAFVTRMLMQRTILWHVCTWWKIKDSQSQKRPTNCFE